MANVTAPLAAGSLGDALDGVPYQLFSTGLSRGLLASPGYPPLPDTGAPAGYSNFYLREGGGYTALLTQADVAGVLVPPEDFELELEGASPDLGHVVLSVEGDLYVRSTAGWRLVSDAPGAQLPASSGGISADGSRVYWTDGTDLYLNTAGTGSVQVDADAGGGGVFQTASSDGSLAFFTKAGDLYRYDAIADAASNLTPGGGVVGVLGASADGSSVYYLTGSGLFLLRNGATSPVAAAADASNYPPSTGTARVSADGTRLLFVSSAALTDYDNTDPRTGAVFSEIYRYDHTAAPPARLMCISCNPAGEPPLASVTLPGTIANGTGPDATRIYRPRVLSADGNRVFFESREELSPSDTNGKGLDVYEWEAGGSGTCAKPMGCLQLISAGDSRDSSFVDASANGEDVFFLTDNSLVRADPGSIDLYDAREGGGFPEPVPPFVCEEDACQPLPSPPDDRSPGTLVPQPGNPPVTFPKTKKGKAKKANKKKKQQQRKKQRQRRGAWR